MRFIRTVSALAIVAMASTGCGTTSGLKPVGDLSADMGAYRSVVVIDFADATKIGAENPDKKAEHHAAVEVAARNFSDRIASKLETSGVFDNVSRGESEGPALRVSGTITRYAQGNAAARLLVGLGAGSSYFDATTDVADNESRETLGQIVTDKNSWGY